MPDGFRIAVQAAALIEPALFCMAGVVLFRNRGRTLAESVSSGVVASLMLICILQLTALLTGFSWFSLLLEAVAAAAAAALCWKSRRQFASLFYEIKYFLSLRNRIVLACFFGCLGYMMVKAFLFIPQTHHLTIFHALGEMTEIPGFFPENAVVLSRHFLRFETGFGLGLFGFLGYIAIVSSTYALSRRYAWMPTSYTVALMVATMPRFIHHALGPGFEIVPAAVALFVILITYRLIETPHLSDLLLLVCSIAFVSSHGAVAFVFSMILTALSLLLLFRRHGLMVWVMVKQQWKTVLVSLVPVFLFSRAWAWRKSSQFEGLDKNADELMGGIANIIRYLFECVDFTHPIDHFFVVMGGFSPHEKLHQLYLAYFDPLFGTRGAAVPFHITGREGAAYSWFGPFGFILVNSAVLYALVRGPRRLKAVAIALAGYLYLLALIPAWRPENVSYFSFFYACAGFSTAIILPPWRLGLRAKLGIQTICIIQLIYTLAIF